MNSVNFLYPASPANVSPSIIQPSASFKKEVGTVMGSIVLFFIVYLLMFLLSIALIIGCVYAGIAIVSNIRHFIGILAGIGLIGLAVMVFIFLVKFLFAVSRFDRSRSVEITEKEQPELFAFIRQVTKDTQTAFPKKIYLSPDVNACVFYDSSFWSMFLPIKKNLQIGLGLVNSVNVSEFKAVMAHEFGHFSQRSMKLGSFVYNVNKIIHNMLFNNSSYSGMLGNWASVSNVFAFFAHITASIAKAIQWVLGKMYGVINKNYMSLSREMEFHADAVAASVSGSKSLVTALRRIEIANAGYSIALDKCNDLFREKKISDNIYHNQRSVLKHLVEEHKMTEEHGLPVVSAEFIANNNNSRINYKDQWASHPTTEEREVNLEKLGVVAEIIHEPAWALFRNPEQWQLQLTKKVYETVVIDKDATVIDNQLFESKLQQDAEQFSLPESYRGFYDKRQIALQSDEELDECKRISPTGFEHIFSPEHIALSKKIRSSASDLEVLKAIEQKNIQVKSFDFDGEKFSQKEAAEVAARLEKEIKEQEQQLKELDREAIAFFLGQAARLKPGMEQELLSAYRNYFAAHRKANAYLESINKLLESLAPIFSGQTIAIEQIQRMIGDLKRIYEPEFKLLLKEWISMGVYEKDQIARGKLEKFIAADYVYFSGNSFFEQELAELSELCNSSWAAVNNWMFWQFKSLLERQLPLINSKE